MLNYHKEKYPRKFKTTLLELSLLVKTAWCVWFLPYPIRWETSSNLAITALKTGKPKWRYLPVALVTAWKSISLPAWSHVFHRRNEGGAFRYSGWQPDVDSYPILHAMKASYQQQFGVEPAVKVIHAGLECGIIGANVPGLDMISLVLHCAHLLFTWRRAYIPSVPKFYDFAATLEQVPLK